MYNQNMARLKYLEKTVRVGCKTRMRFGNKLAAD
jgi:hypothetical protein